MRSFKKIISLAFLMCFFLVSPLQTEALTVEEITTEISNLQRIDIQTIIDLVNYDDSKNVDEINNLLDASLENSNSASLKLAEINALMSEIKSENEGLLAIEDREEYNQLVELLESKIENANTLNVTAKDYSELALSEYTKALELYEDLKLQLEEEQKAAELIIDSNIDKTNSRLEKINGLLEELDAIEVKLEETYDSALSILELAKANVQKVNGEFNSKLEEIKGYVSENVDINELMEVNANYLTSGILYAISQTSLELLNMQIGLVEDELEKLNNDLKGFDEILLPLKEELENKKAELEVAKSELQTLNEEHDAIIDEITKLNEDLAKENENLDDYEEALANKNAEIAHCESYADELKAAIEAQDKELVIKLMIAKSDKFKNSNITEENIVIDDTPSFDVNLNLVYFITVTDPSITEPGVQNTFKYTYDYNEETGVVTIYEYDYIERGPVLDNTLKGELSQGKYTVIFNGQEYDFVKIPLSGNIMGVGYNFSVSGFTANNKYYKVEYNNGWKATEQKIGYNVVSYWPVNVSIYLENTSNVYDVEVLEAAHYEPNGTYFTSSEVVDYCDTILTDEIEAKIAETNTKISEIESEILAKENEKTVVLTNIANKNTDISNKENAVVVAQTAYNVEKDSLTNEDGLTYAEVEARIKELEEKLDGMPTITDEDFAITAEAIREIGLLIANGKDGNIDVKAIIEAINGLNVGLNIKKGLVEKIDQVLAEKYVEAKNELIAVGKENVDALSNALSQLALLTKDTVKANLEYAEAEIKYNLAKANYEILLQVKEIVLQEKANSESDLEKLQTLKTNNNLDFLNEVLSKLEMAEGKLVTVNANDEVKVNEYQEPIVEDKEDVKEDNKNNVSNNNSGNKNDTTEKEEDIEQDKEEDKNEDDVVFDPEDESILDYWWVLLIIAVAGVVTYFVVDNYKNRK